MRKSPFLFEAKVTDDIAVKKVELYYRQDKSTEWKKINMVKKPGSKDWYQSEVYFDVKDFWVNPEKPFSDNGPFYIYIKAYDAEKARQPTESIR